MLSGLVTIFFFFGVIALTAVVFFGWVAFAVVRLIVGGVTSLVLPAYRPAQQLHIPVNGATRCLTRGCQAVNPSDARFCRRCGRGLPAAQRVQVRRAAVW